MNKAYKFRIYPNNEQKTMFAKTFGCVRFIYNRMLSDKINYYRETKKNLSGLKRLTVLLLQMHKSIFKLRIITFSKIRKQDFRNSKAKKQTEAAIRQIV